MYQIALITRYADAPTDRRLLGQARTITAARRRAERLANDAIRDSNQCVTVQNGTGICKAILFRDDDGSITQRG